MMGFIKCALLCSASPALPLPCPCPVPALPCPCPALPLPCPCLTMPSPLLSHTVLQHIMISLSTCLAFWSWPLSNCPWANSFCPALKYLTLSCPACPLPCPALPHCNSKLCVSCRAVQPVSVLPMFEINNSIFSPQAITAAAVQFLKLLGAVLVVRRALGPYKPLAPNWWVSFPLPYLLSCCCTYSKLMWLL